MVLLVYDVTNPDTFQLLRQWLEGVKARNEGRNLTGVVVANKVDLENRAQVSSQNGQEFAASIGFEFFEVSTQQNKGVEEPFKALARLHTENYEQRLAQLAEID
eukprot:CAMPEP_0170492220 /NCGR_PEP_ID=MMETSP0208-20121228/11866_1 /TAXON_ID=197538 /ORGANISM="Strombidium inclinatum, Strain S3" /LENGTH=103 /DNA_ID=CAMNT_0010767927 /DNA_START=255 /DNA_END=564 /DNA_ORIENTATION=+